MVSHSPNQQALSPKERQLLHEVLADLVSNFGLGPVKQERLIPLRPGALFVVA